MAGLRDIGPETKVLELIAEFLEYSKRVNKASTYENYKNHLHSFYKSIGTIRIGSLKPFHVERWLAKRYPHTSNGSTINGAMRSVQRVMNWARKSGRIPKSPLEGMEKPQATTRDVYLMPEQFARLIAAITDQEFLDIVTSLRETGCRPLEARQRRSSALRPCLEMLDVSKGRVQGWARRQGCTSQ